MSTHPCYFLVALQTLSLSDIPLNFQHLNIANIYQDLWGSKLCFIRSHPPSVYSHRGLICVLCFTFNLGMHCHGCLYIRRASSCRTFLADVLLIGSCLFKCFSSVYKRFIPLLFFDRHWCPWDDNCDIGSGHTAKCGKKLYDGSLIPSA